MSICPCSAAIPCPRAWLGLGPPLPGGAHGRRFRWRWSCLKGGFRVLQMPVGFSNALPPIYRYAMFGRCIGPKLQLRNPADRRAPVTAPASLPNNVARVAQLCAPCALAQQQQPIWRCLRTRLAFGFAVRTSIERVDECMCVWHLFVHDCQYVDRQQGPHELRCIGTYIHHTGHATP